MINLFLGVASWVVRNLLSLILILGVLLCGKWLHTKWEEAVVARVQLKQLQLERDAMGGELLRVSLH
jgi:hypothetical protein